MSKIDAGEVTITLGGEERTLKCYLNAARAINKHFGGLVNAESRVLAVDLDAMIFVVQAGLGIEDNAEREVVAQQVFDAGAYKLGRPLILYLNSIGLGGVDKPEGDAKPGKKTAAA